MEEGDTKGTLGLRPSLKTHASFNNYTKWKQKLRENCFKRVREDRSRLLWKLRLPEAERCPDHKDLIKSSLEDIVSDELRKIKESDESCGPSSADAATDDMIWEYDGLHTAYQGDCEEILMEMQRIFYEDIRMEEARKVREISISTWEDEEDDYLARKVYEYMQLNDEKVEKEIWCPICKQGELQENDYLICCSQCELKLKKGDEVNLELLRLRLGEAHSEHFDRGCRLKPEFCLETKFELTALYINCRGCNTFEVVL